VYDVRSTLDGAGNLVRLELTTWRDEHPNDSPDVVLNALASVARPGSRFELIDQDGDVDRRVLVEDDGGRRWVGAVSRSVFGEPEGMSREARHLLVAALDEETEDPAWRDVVAQALSLIGAFRAENDWS
jgi:hypothetical protein